MGEVYCIVPRIDAVQAARLSTSLRAMVTRGDDPGPRGAQIRALGKTLAISVQALRQELAKLGLSEAAIGLDLDRLESAARVTEYYDADNKYPAA